MIEFDIDAVVTFVDGNESVWKQKFNYTLNRLQQKNELPSLKDSFTEKRYRNNGELELCLCGIRKNLPWIRKIWLVVSNSEQVPEYVHKYNVEVVLHEQIIPSQYLPTFNSCAIELFLHKIPGLSRHWLFFNDDLFILKPMPPESFFTSSGKPINRYTLLRSRHAWLNTAWFNSFRNAYLEVLKLFGLADESRGRFVLVPWHHVKSIDSMICEEAWSKMHQVFLNSITPFRSIKSINGYVFQIYERFSRLGIVKRRNERLYMKYSPDAAFCELQDNNQTLDGDLTKIRKQLMAQENDT